MTPEQRVAEALARILSRRHPGTLWTPIKQGEEPPPGAVVVHLAGPEDIEAVAG